MRILLQDLRYALRNLLKSRGFTLIATATLAIGIGANTAMFSIVDAVLLRPPAFRDPDRVMRLYETESAPGKYPFAGPDFVDWKAQNSTFEDMALFGWASEANLSGEGRPDHVRSLGTSANFFSVLGVNPFLGRTWVAGEDQPERERVAILSYALWKSRFAGDPRVVGRTVELDAQKHTVIGVMPPSFRYPTQAQVWVPLDMSTKGLRGRGSHWANAIGRLKTGATVKSAQADLTLIASRLEQLYPDSNHKVGAVVVPLHEDLVGKSRNSLLIMLSAVGLVLLIACANVANLLLSRAMGRQKEMAIRSALGAGRSRLVRQLLTESLVLTAAGAVGGLALASGVITLFSRAQSFGIPRFNLIELNGTVLAFTLLLAVATALIFGIFPALRTAGRGVHQELKGGAGSSVSPGRRRRLTSDALVVGEVALSVLLLASAGLVLKDFARLRNMDIGVRQEGLWTAAIRLPEATYKADNQKTRFAETLLERSRQIAGVTTAALSDRMPLEGGSNYYINVRGRVPAPMSGELVESHSVSPEYFQAMGIRLLKGRLFTPADVQTVMALNERMRPFWEAWRTTSTRPPADKTNAVIYPVVVNEAMVRAFWPNEDPLGQMFSQGGASGPWRQVIGVANDVRQRGLTQKAVPEAYDLFDASSRFFLVLRTAKPPASLTGDMRRTLAQLDGSLALFSVRTMDDVVADNSQGQRFLTLLVGSFAALAAVLAAIGIYGVLSYLVTQRTREIGIRMALGASRGRVLAGVLTDGMRLAVLGLAIGIAGSFAAGRVLASLLYEVKPRDPGVLAVTAGLLAVVALAASYLPAWRAARLDPTTALRFE
jgi:putative ABC transport system permease protein